MSAEASLPTATRSANEACPGGQPPVAAHSMRQRSAQISSTNAPSSLSNGCGIGHAPAEDRFSAARPARARGRRKRREGKRSKSPSSIANLALPPPPGAAGRRRRAGREKRGEGKGPKTPSPLANLALPPPRSEQGLLFPSARVKAG